MLAGKEDGPSAHPPAQSPAPVPSAAAAPVPSKAAPPPPPPAPNSAGEFAKAAIRREAKETANGPADPAPSGSSSLSDVPRVVLALAVVIALILFLRWGGRRIFGLPGGGRASQAVQVLSRSALTPRQQVVLLKVGRRVLVVADNGSQMNSLCQITDPDEVASLVGQLRSEKGGSSASANAGAFGGLFGGSRKKFDDLGDDDSSANAAQPQSASGAPKPPVHRPSVRGSGRPADSPRVIIDPEDIGFDEAEAEAAVKVARQELMGLKEKLRMVSERFGMPEEKA